MDLSTNEKLIKNYYFKFKKLKKNKIHKIFTNLASFVIFNFCKLNIIFCYNFSTIKKKILRMCRIQYKKTKKKSFGQKFFSEFIFLV